MSDITFVIKKATSDQPLVDKVVDKAATVSGEERDIEFKNLVSSLYDFLKQHPTKNEKEQRLLELLQEILRETSQE